MSKVFSLSEAGSIAIHSMVLIACADSKLNVLKIAEKTGSSKHHIAKILQRLVKDDFLISNRGPNGGFALKREASEIDLLEIYESIEGKIEISKCPINNSICAFERCLMGNIISNMTLKFQEYMKNQNLSEFVKP